jgi:GNAT superfamily N-acetyltransferase
MQRGAAIERLLASLDPSQRFELVAAMSRIRPVLVGSRGLILRALEPGDLGWVVERHSFLGATEYGWAVTFEGLVARIVAGFAERRDNQREAAWIAEIDGDRVGCVFCAAADAKFTAQLRLLLVEPSARRAGVGSRLVNECLRFAARSGSTSIMLWTQDVQLEARCLYQRAGFKFDHEEPHHLFGHDLVGEYWSRGLHSS